MPLCNNSAARATALFQVPACDVAAAGKPKKNQWQIPG